MGLEAALTWKICTFGLTKQLPCTDSFTYKKTIVLFQMNRDDSGNSIDFILVGKCPVCYQVKEKKK